MDLHIGAKRRVEVDAADRIRRLGHPLRLAMIATLRRHGEQCVCALAVELGREQATLSRHLRILRDGRLVQARRDGPNVFYSVDEATVASVIDVLAEPSSEDPRHPESAR